LPKLHTPAKGRQACLPVYLPRGMAGRPNPSHVSTYGGRGELKVRKRKKLNQYFS